MKKLFLILATASTVFAQSMCEEYCETCSENPSDASCERVFKICGCAPAEATETVPAEAAVEPVPEQVQDTVAAEQPADTVPPTEKKDVAVEKKKNFRLGAGADFRMPTTEEYGRFVFDNDALSLGFGIHFVTRWDFKNEQFSFLTGLNLSYHFTVTDYAEYKGYSGEYNSEVYLDYTTFNIEVPLSMRVNFNIHKTIKPFVSYTFTIRKPVYEWMYYEYDFTYKGKDYWGKGSENSAFEFNDWEFSNGFGIGAEIFDRISFEYIVIFYSTDSSFSNSNSDQHTYSDGFENFLFNITYFF